MPNKGIGGSDGSFFDNRFDFFKQVRPGEWAPSDDVDENMVKTPSEVMTGKKLDDVELNPSTGLGLEVSFKQPLGSPEKPAGEFKPDASQIVPADMLNIKRGGPPVPMPETVAHIKTLENIPGVNPDITNEDVDQAVNIGLSAGPGALSGKSMDALIANIESVLKNPKAPLPQGAIDTPKYQVSSRDEAEWQAFLANEAKAQNGLDPMAAADKFHQIYTTRSPGDAIKYAHQFEEMASPEQFAQYERRVNDSNYYQNSKAFQTDDPFQQQPFHPNPWKPDYKINIPISEAPPPEPTFWNPASQKWEPAKGRAFEDSIADIEKKSPKEAFLEGAKAVHAAWQDTVSSLKASMLSKFRGPPKEIDTSGMSPSEIAAAKGYTETAFRGLKIKAGKELNPTFDPKINYNEMYSSNSPLLADMYSSYLHAHPRVGEAFEKPGSYSEGAQVMPLLINTKDYHYYNANGGVWSVHNPKAIEQAMDMKKKGVIVDNVWDEPHSTYALGSPKKIFITFPEGASTVKSRFAQKFDENSNNMLHTIPAIGVGGTAGYIAMHQLDAQRDEN